MRAAYEAEQLIAREEQRTTARAEQRAHVRERYLGGTDIPAFRAAKAETRERYLGGTDIPAFRGAKTETRDSRPPIAAATVARVAGGAAEHAQEVAARRAANDLAMQEGLAAFHAQRAKEQRDEERRQQLLELMRLMGMQPKLPSDALREDEARAKATQREELEAKWEVDRQPSISTVKGGATPRRPLASGTATSTSPHTDGRRRRQHPLPHLEAPAVWPPPELPYLQPVRSADALAFFADWQWVF